MIKKKIKKNVSLAPMTSFGVGGPAKYFLEFSSEKELLAGLKFAKDNSLEVFFLGSGSNVLVSDEGFDGLVLRNAIKKRKAVKKDKIIELTVGSGEDWPTLVDFVVEKGWSGIEGLAGIPGTAGAAPVQNIGAYGQSISEAVKSVRAYDLKKNKFKVFSNKESEFAYRTSLFKKNIGRFVITEIVLELSNKSESGLHYKDNRFSIDSEVTSKNPTATDVRDAVVSIRAKKGMVMLPEYNSYKSAGSFFMAPLVTKKKFKEIKTKASDLDKVKTEKLMPWYWDTDEGTVKIAPAFLLEFTKFNKGYKEGSVGISPKHSLAIINCDNATASDIISLARKMQKAVKSTFDVDLISEVRLMGFLGNPLGKSTSKSR